MAQVIPTTSLSEPVPAIVRPGRPAKAADSTGRHGLRAASSVIPPMPSDLPPGQWSEQAMTVLRERYLLKDDRGEVVETPDQMCWRVAWDIASAEANFGKGYEEVAAVAREYYSLMAAHEFLPNSPTLANAGKGNGLQYSACFVLPVEDSIEGIFDGIKWQALIHKSGGGTGFSFSRLRQAGAIVGSTKGVASGPVSFMKIYDAATEQVKQGGMRRGANMGILCVDHPDIREFIHCKDKGGINNFNISVAATEKFMEAYFKDGEYDLVDPKTKQPVGRLKAREVMKEITRAAWATGDPGMIFLDRMNAGTGNPVPSLGPIEATNPCVAGDTRIYTQFGLINIADLVDFEGIGVLTKQSWQGAQRIVATGEKAVYRLETAEGYQLKLTTDHQVLTAGGWKRAGELVKGDMILLNSRKGGFGKEGNLELGQVLGWLVGDGTMKAAEAVLMFFGGEKKRLAPAFAQMVARLTDGMQILDRAYPVGVGWIDDRDEARVGSTRLWRLAESHGITRENKLVVPEKVFWGCEEMQRGFLQALFTADGHVAGTTAKGVSVRLTSTSFSLLIEVQRLLLNFGIASKIYQFRRREGRRFLPNGKGGRKKYLCRACHDLVIAKDNLRKFAREIGFLADYKSVKLASLLAAYKRGAYREPFAARFLRLIPCGVEKVYDLVEPVTRSFVANGLVVHNCGEQPLYPFDVCNLGSIFLTYFVTSDSGRAGVDWRKLERVTKLAVRFLDSVIERNLFPLPQIKEMATQVRRIGLGIGGWADMLALLGISYDSDEALVLAGKVMQFIHDKGHEASEELAGERGAFPKFSESIYRDGRPLRNATVTTVAPTGSISIIADSSTGIEPFFAMAFKHDNGRGRVMDFVSPVFEKMAAGQEWYTAAVREQIAEEGTVAEVEGVPEKLKSIFVTAHNIIPERHIKMQAAFQKYTDNAVSKTINLSHEATAEEVESAYVAAYRLGCQGITVYRDRCRETQVLNLGMADKTATEKQANDQTIEDKSGGEEQGDGYAEALPERPVRVEGATYRIETPLGTAFITVNHNEKHEPFEVFIAVGKAGSEVAAMAEALGRLISTTLRFGNHRPAGERAREIVEQLRGIGGGSAVGFGPDRVRSLPDAVAKAISLHFQIIDNRYEINDGAEEKAPPSVPLSRIHNPLSLGFRDLCPSCGAAALIFEEGCAKCSNCGFSKC